MEHKLIQGGAQYLPFARSRIAQWRAEGRQYAGGRWIMPTGETVTARIVGDDDYIEIEGGSCTLTLDHGVVSAPLLQIDGVDVPPSFDAGALTPTTPITAYEADFVTPKPGAKFRLNPGLTDAGQLAGNVSHQKTFRGAIPVAYEPLSFAPGKREDTSTDPSTWIPRTDDAGVVAKKTAATTCPASVFTGKCRLYVQALYGAPLYSYKGSPAGKLAFHATATGGDPPVLAVNSYVHVGDKTVYSPVILTTSSGVWLDPDTGKHWLFNVLSNTIEVFPLVGSTCAESMRRYLKTAAKGTVLDAEDKKRLEAYVLSTCLPDRSKIQFASGAISTLPGTSMGYGWHWNWSGTNCDKVVNAEFSQDATNVAMQSTHYRLAIKKTATPHDDKSLPQQNWIVTQSTVEGPKSWAVRRDLWCITEPRGGAQFKTTPQHTTLFACKAPFYVFYQGDEAQVCEVTVANIPASSTFKQSNPFFAPTAKWTVGLEGGSCESANINAHFEATFAIGSLTVANLAAGNSSSGSRHEIYPKTAASDFDDGAHSFGDSTSSWIYKFGFPGHANSAPTPTDSGPGTLTYDQLILFYSSPTVVGKNADRHKLASYTYESCTPQITYVGMINVIVPTHDAEAVFVKSRKYNTATRTSRVQHERASLVYVMGDDPLSLSGTDGHVYEYYLWQFADDSDISSSTPADLVITTEEGSQSQLLFGGGTLDTLALDVSAFFADNTEDTVAMSFNLWSGIGTSGAALSPGIIAARNLPGDVASPVFVGVA